MICFAVQRKIAHALKVKLYGGFFFLFRFVSPYSFHFILTFSSGLLWVFVVAEGRDLKDCCTQVRFVEFRGRGSRRG